MHIPEPVDALPHYVKFNSAYECVKQGGLLFKPYACWSHKFSPGPFIRTKKAKSKKRNPVAGVYNRTHDFQHQKIAKRNGELTNYTSELSKFYCPKARELLILRLI